MAWKTANPMPAGMAKLAVLADAIVWRQRNKHPVLVCDSAVKRYTKNTTSG